MNNLIKEEQVKEETRTVNDRPKLQLITGGKGGGPDTNWLGDLSVGDVFIARHKSTKVDNPIMEVFEVKQKTEDKRYAFLVANVHVGAEEGVKMWTDTLRFSRGYDFVAVLGTVIENG